MHRAPDATERRFTTSDLLTHEQAILNGAQARRGEGTGMLNPRQLVDAALASRAVRANGRAGRRDPRLDLKRSRRGERRGAGRDGQDVHGGPARPGLYGPWRVRDRTGTLVAVRELNEQAGIAQAWTLTRLALDLEADGGGFGAGPAVLILDEAGMASTRETARVDGGRTAPHGSRSSR